MSVANISCKKVWVEVICQVYDILRFERGIFTNKRLKWFILAWLWCAKIDKCAKPGTTFSQSQICSVDSDVHAFSHVWS